MILEMSNFHVNQDSASIEALRPTSVILSTVFVNWDTLIALPWWCACIITYGSSMLSCAAALWYEKCVVLTCQLIICSYGCITQIKKKSWCSEGASICHAGNLWDFFNLTFLIISKLTLDSIFSFFLWLVLADSLALSLVAISKSLTEWFRSSRCFSWIFHGCIIDSLCW